MMVLFATVLFWLLATTVQAATLFWDAPLPGVVSPIAVERSTTTTGPFTTIATLPAGDTSYILTPGSYGFYRVRYTALATSLPSNVVQFSLDLYTGLVTDRLTALETRMTALEAEAIRIAPSPPPAPYQQITCYDDLVVGHPPVCTQTVPTVEVPVTPPPAPTSNLTVRQIDSDHIEITCNGVGISTTGSGTRRLMECRH